MRFRHLLSFSTRDFATPNGALMPAQIQDFMTKAPHSIGRQQTLASALSMMQRLRVRHLPVLDGGELLGVVSERDLYLIDSLKGVDPEQVTVEEAMSQDPLVVSPEDDLPQVAKLMAARRAGSAVISRGGKISGIFTTTDALVALAKLAKTAPATGAALKTRKSGAGTPRRRRS